MTVSSACAAAVAAAGVDGAGLTIVVNAIVRETLHVTDRVAGELAELQLTVGEGPCVDSLAGGGPVLAGDLDAPDCLTRWPAFAPAALTSGARAVFALPLHLGGIRLGVLDLYRTRTGPLAARQLADALSFADTVGMLLLDRTAGLPAEAESRFTADLHQPEVHQATGMVLAQLGVSADVAFARLRAYAYVEDRRMGDVARDVIDRRLRFDPDPPVRSGDESSRLG